MRVRLDDGTRLFVDVEGAGWVPDGPRLRERPTLLAIHGGPGGDHSLFKPVLGTLADCAQVVYVDLRGQGRSDRSTPDHWNLATWGSDLAALCGVLGIERPVLFGDSAGSYVALQLAVDWPHLPAGLVLTSASARNRPDRGAAVFEQLGGAAARDAAIAFWDDPTAEHRGAFLRYCRPLYGKRSGVVGEAAFRVVANPEVFAHFAAAERKTFDLLPRLATVQCRALIMNGDVDPVTTLADARDVAAALPHGRARLEVFTGCGHSLLEEDPERVLALARDFLANVSSP